MKVLVGYEFSGRVRDAFLKRGHDAYSVDLEPTESRLKTNHWTGSIQQLFNLIADSEISWDLGIFFPPCTHLAVSGSRWFKKKKKYGLQQAAIREVLWLMNLPINKISIENPIGVLSTIVRKPDQIIQPWQFGHGETKATCLWLKNLPCLQPTSIVNGREHRVHHEPPSPNQSRNRSRTYQGIADAMATQWGNL